MDDEQPKAMRVYVVGSKQRLRVELAEVNVSFWKLVELWFRVGLALVVALVLLAAVPVFVLLAFGALGSLIG